MDLIKRFWVYIVLFLVVSLLITFLANFTLVSVDHPVQSTKVSIRNSAGDLTQLNAGLSLVHTGKYSYDSESNDSRSIGNFEAKALRINKIKVSPQKTQDIIGLSSGLSDKMCSFAGNGGEYYSYVCNGLTNIMKYDFATDQNIAVLDGQKLYNVTSLISSGAVGIAFPDKLSESPYIAFTDGSNYKKLPIKLSGIVDLNNIKLVSVKDDSFVLINFNDDTILYFNQIADTKPIKISIPDDINSNSNILLSENDKTITVGYDPDSSSEDSPQTKIKLISVAKDNPSKIQLNKVINLSNVSYLKFDSDDNLLVVNSDGLMSKINVKNKNNTVVISGVSSAQLLGDKLYGVIGGDLYQIDTTHQTANLVFDSPIWDVKKIDVLQNKLMIYAKPINIQNSSYSLFSLSSNETKTPSLTSLLPYSSGVLPIRNMTFRDTSIYIKIKLDYFESNRATNSTIIDQSEYLSKQAMIKKQLVKDGFSTNKYKLYFSY